MLARNDLSVPDDAPDQVRGYRRVPVCSEDAVASGRWISAVAWERQCAASRRRYVNHACEQVLGVMAAKTGCAVDDIRAARGANHCMRLARSRAIYLMHTVCSCGLSEIAGAIGINAETIRKIVRRVEAGRDDPRTDRALDELELELMGAPQ